MLNCAGKKGFNESSPPGTLLEASFGCIFYNSAILHCEQEAISKPKAAHSTLTMFITRPKIQRNRKNLMLLKVQTSFLLLQYITCCLLHCICLKNIEYSTHYFECRASTARNNSSLEQRVH